MEKIILTSIIISGVSLVIAILTLYKTLLKPSNISVLIGPEIQVCHHNFPKLATGLYVPVTFINTSPNIGAIFKCAITIFRTDAPQQKFFMFWRDFTRISVDSNWKSDWKHDEQAHSFAVNGKSSISKIVWFPWFGDSKPKLHFKQGDYTLIVNLWVGRDKKPKNSAFNFHITQELEALFQNRINTQSNTTIMIMLNKELDRNKILTNHEYKSLLE